jgi:hypothetical protein
MVLDIKLASGLDRDFWLGEFLEQQIVDLLHRR